VTVTLTVNPVSRSFIAGNHDMQIRFTNVTNGRGSAIRTALLKVEVPTPPNYLIDDVGRDLVDEQKQRLLAR
jgi:hypothetical protein